MRIRDNVPLAPMTTLGIGGAAARFASVQSYEDLDEALRIDDQLLVIGHGSNLVVGDAGWPGLVVQIAMPFLLAEDYGDHVLVTVAAGLTWDELVRRAVDAKLVGLECMSGIPGLVGATPMQNVGAYGQEVSDTIEWVRVVDRKTREMAELTNAECKFAYRTSMLKGTTQFIVTDVAFRLTRGDESAPIRYAELTRALGIREGERAPLANVRETVIALRRGKGMVVDPADPDSKSAGSFFTNPLVEPARVPEGAPQWPQPDGRVKVSAAWLIERAGFAKGYTKGRVAISSKHALALVNRGGATASELLALAREIQDGVRARFAIDLVPEPVIV